MTRRLLIITYHFPPDGSIGGWRWSGLSKYLARLGWTVEVITAAKQTNVSPTPGVTVHYCPRRGTFNDLYNAWSKRGRSTAGGSPQGSQPSQLSQPSQPTAAAPDPARSDGALDALRSIIAMSMVFPDDARGWILRAAGCARARLKETTFDAVVTSGPPHSAHLAGILACAGNSTPRWLDMRDPWAAWVALADKTAGAGAFQSAARLRLIRWLEAIVFRNTRQVIVNTPEFAATVKATYPTHDIVCVPNGIDAERLPAPAVDKFDGLSIAYAGTLYAGRNVSTVMRAIAAFLKKHPDARGKLKLRVAGSMDTQHEAEFWSEVARDDLRDTVEVLGRISGAEALDLVNRSHIALVLAQDQAMQVPAKLYECVAMGTSTLVIAEGTSAAAREARQIGAVTCEPSDVDSITGMIEELWLKPAPATRATYSFGYDQIARRMDALLSGPSPDRSSASSR